MAANVKPMRTAGAVPADYRGPVYWRVMEYGFVAGPSAEHIEFTDSQERLDRLFIDRYKMPGKDIFTSGTVAGPEVWLDMMLFKSVFPSGPLGDAFDRAGLRKAFRLFKCRVV